MLACDSCKAVGEEEDIQPVWVAIFKQKQPVNMSPEFGGQVADLCGDCRVGLLSLIKSGIKGVITDAPTTKSPGVDQVSIIQADTVHVGTSVERPDGGGNHPVTAKPVPDLSGTVPAVGS